MKSSGATKSLLSACLLLLTVDAVGGPEASAPSYTVTPVNPAAKQAVQFTDTTTGEVPTSWLWDFGDGQISTSPAPSHTYTNPGVYTARLTVTTISGTQPPVTRQLDVSPESVLRLNAAHSFDVTLLATDQRTGRTGEGKAIPQNDIFGFFAIPALTSNPDNPEVFVKVLDGRVINGQFWVFYGGLTDLEYTLSVKENATGIVKSYHKAPGSAEGGFDTSGFTGPAATATPTPSGGTATPTPPGATPTPTPTPGSSTTVVLLTVQQFEWSFDGGGPNFTMRVGQRYEVRITDTDPPGTNGHGFPGISALGMSGASLDPGETVTRIVTPTAGQVGTHGFACSVSSCGDGHDDMIGSIQVVP